MKSLVYMWLSLVFYTTFTGYPIVKPHLKGSFLSAVRCISLNGTLRVEMPVVVGSGPSSFSNAPSTTTTSHDIGKAGRSCIAADTTRRSLPRHNVRYLILSVTWTPDPTLPGNPRSLHTLIVPSRPIGDYLSFLTGTAFFKRSWFSKGFLIWMPCILLAQIDDDSIADRSFRKHNAILSFFKRWFVLFNGMKLVHVTNTAYNRNQRAVVKLDECGLVNAVSQIRVPLLGYLRSGGRDGFGRNGIAGSGSISVVVQWWWRRIKSVVPYTTSMNR